MCEGRYNWILLITPPMIKNTRIRTMDHGYIVGTVYIYIHTKDHYWILQALWHYLIYFGFNGERNQSETGDNDQQLPLHTWGSCQSNIPSIVLTPGNEV